MSTTQPNVHVLDAAYKAFPSFSEWATRASVDSTRWDRYTASIAERAKQSPPDVLKRARDIAKRAAAIDTGAIEGLYEVDRGFTYTVAFQTAAWEMALAQKGEHVKSLFEAQLHAYDYVLDLATKAEPISEAAIRFLHEEVCRAQPTYRVMTEVGPQEQPLPKGQYKTLPNHARTRKGTDHSYAPVDVTPVEMDRFVRELRTDAFLVAHPVLQAAYAHYGLVVIHPFADGNGRVARALASAFTYRAVSMPIVILSEHRETYLNALESADNGNYQDFVDFMLARCLDTIALIEQSLRSALTPNPEQIKAVINELYVTKSGYNPEQVDEAGANLLTYTQNAIGLAFKKFSDPKISGGASIVGGYYPVPSGYRIALGGGQILHVIVRLASPVDIEQKQYFGLLLPNILGEDDVQLVNLHKKDTAHKTIFNLSSSQDDIFVARIDELIPSIAGILQIRIDMFVEAILSKTLVELNNSARQKMEKATPTSS